MIKSITLSNFRGHANTNVPLGRFTLLVGDNGVGKSSVLEAVHLLGQVFSKPIGHLFAGPRSLQWLTRSSPGVAPSPTPTSPATENHLLTIHLALDDGSWIELESSDPDNRAEMKVRWNQVAVGGKTGEIGAGAVTPALPPRELRIAQSAVVLHFDSHELAKPSSSDDEEPRIEFSGYGLATALKDLKATRLADFEKFEAMAKKVLPALSAISFARVKSSTEDVRLVTLDSVRVPIPDPKTFVADQLLLQFTGTALLPAHCASEGTLLVLGLLAFLHLPRCPRVVLLDDIDRGLHPRAQRELATGLRAILAQRPETQMIATSHSPYLVDSFKPDEVVVLSRTNEKVLARPLSEHPDKKLVEALTVGELLSASGSDWFGL